jgi:hypothetical protein
MVLSAPQLHNVTLHLWLEKTADGRSRATALELPACVTEAATDEQAIAQLRQMVTERLQQGQIIPMTIELPQPMQPENPWADYIGIFKDDPDFAEIARDLRLERGFDEMGLM